MISDSKTSTGIIENNSSAGSVIYLLCLSMEVLVVIDIMDPSRR